jgi:hypothetical protein
VLAVLAVAVLVEWSQRLVSLIAVVAVEVQVLIILQVLAVQVSLSLDTQILLH